VTIVEDTSVRRLRAENGGRRLADKKYKVTIKVKDLAQARAVLASVADTQTLTTALQTVVSDAPAPTISGASVVVVVVTKLKTMSNTHLEAPTEADLKTQLLDKLGLQAGDLTLALTEAVLKTEAVDPKNPASVDGNMACSAGPTVAVLLAAVVAML